MPNAKLGAKVDRYSFFVRLLPPLLHTGLARRTNIAITLIYIHGPAVAPTKQVVEIIDRSRTVVVQWSERCKSSHNGSTRGSL